MTDVGWMFPCLFVLCVYLSLCLFICVWVSECVLIREETGLCYIVGAQGAV